MDSAKKLELIDGLTTQAEDLAYEDSGKLDSLLRRGEMVIRNILGDKSKYLKDLNSITFHPMPAPVSMAPDEQHKRECWYSGQDAMLNLFETIKEEVMLFGLTASQNQVEVNSETQTNKVFVVHGHDSEMKESVARVLEKLGLQPIILHEQPNQGRTIIEKFTDYSNVSFAVILLSPDDLAYPKKGNPDEAKLRARQNVILELGFFLGKLGRQKVLTLFKKSENFELPSDYDGVVFTAFDDAGHWQFELIRELRACGFAVDANTLL